MAQEIDNNFIDQCTNKMNELLSSAQDKGDSNMQLILEAFKQLVLLILTSFRTLLNAHNDLKDLNEKSVNLLEQIQREKEELKQEKEELKQEKDELKQENEKLKQALLASSKVNANNIITNEQNKKEKFEGHGSEKQPRKNGVDSSSHQRDNQKPREPRRPKSNVQRKNEEVYELFGKRFTKEEAKKLINTIVTDPTTGKQYIVNSFKISSTKQETIVTLTDVTYYKAELKSLDGEEKKLAPIAEADFLQKSKMGMSLMCELINYRFMLKSPVYRLVQYLEDLGLNYSKQQLYSYFEICSFMLMVIFERLEEELANATLIGIDETFWSCREKRRKQLEERNKNGTVASNQDGDDGGSPSMRCYIFGIITKKVCLYYFRESRNTDFAKNKLIEHNVKRDSYVMTDGLYKNNFSLDEKTKEILFDHANCLVHVRRKFCTFYNSAQRNGVVTATIRKHNWEQDVTESKLFIDLISNLFHEFNEIEESHANDDPNELLKIRQEKLKPLIDQILDKGERIWKEIRKPNKNEESNADQNRRDCCDKFYNAIQYLINSKEKIQKFLYNPYGVLSNNFTEQKFRELDILRESMVGNDTYEGAESLAIIYAIYKTALLHKINFYDYLMKVFKELTLYKDQINYKKNERGTIVGYIDHSIPENVIESLLPWNIKL